MNYRHAMRINHPAFDFGHAGITFEVSPDESVWFSVERFERESEQITLRTAPNGKTFYRDDAASLVQFTGV